MAPRRVLTASRRNSAQPLLALVADSRCTPRPSAPSPSPSFPSPSNSTPNGSRASAYLLLSPKKRAIASVLHNDLHWPYTKIAQDPRLGGVDPSTIRKGLKTLSLHGGDFYHNGRKGKCGSLRACLGGSALSGVCRVCH
ncbi:hypothetical protein C8F01DRAFT_1236665 [Mycena amicta]|nr:hypothetical protein C8F01DRAFT_1236665 [Mycena amicta]